MPENPGAQCSGAAPAVAAAPGLAHLQPGTVAVLTLSDPARRNALGQAMFAALARALADAERLAYPHAADDPAEASRARPAPPAACTSTGPFDAPSCCRAEPMRVLLLRGAGPAFCGGFDLAACVERPALLRTFVEQLSACVRALRAMPVPVVAEVQGAALAGGCALLAGCDFVLVAPDARLGYPVHRIGVSPAVTLPALMASAGPGRAREVTMGGALVDGAEAVRMGLATRCAASAEALPAEARVLCEALARKGPHALRATKAWLNELDGTRGGARFEHAAAASAAAADGDEFATLLRAFWAARER